MHEIWTVATDVQFSGVSVSVCKEKQMHPAKDAAQIEVLFKAETPGGPRNQYRCQDVKAARSFPGH